MKSLLTQYSAYNLWATQLLTDKILKLSPELQEQQVKSSFPSLKATLLHMWDAEAIWWQRMRLLEQINIPSVNFSGDLEEVVKGLINQSRLWNDWTQNASDHMFDHEFIYSNSKKEKFKQPVYQMLMHMFNHGTYHRGQLVTILRQLEVDAIPQTDFIVWSRKRP